VSTSETDGIYQPDDVTRGGSDLVHVEASEKHGAGSLELAKTVRDYIGASRSANTLRAYASDWRDFRTWCESHGVCPLPAAPATVALYIAESHG
jgi:hypothetical protein